MLIRLWLLNHLPRSWARHLAYRYNTRMLTHPRNSPIRLFCQDCPLKRRFMGLTFCGAPLTGRPPVALRVTQQPKKEPPSPEAKGCGCLLVLKSSLVWRVVWRWAPWLRRWVPIHCPLNKW